LTTPLHLVLPLLQLFEERDAELERYDAQSEEMAAQLRAR